MDKVERKLKNFVLILNMNVYLQYMIASNYQKYLITHAQIFTILFSSQLKG